MKIRRERRTWGNGRVSRVGESLNHDIGLTSLFIEPATQVRAKFGSVDSALRPGESLLDGYEREKRDARGS